MDPRTPDLAEVKARAAAVREALEQVTPPPAVLPRISPFSPPSAAPAPGAAAAGPSAPSSARPSLGRSSASGSPTLLPAGHSRAASAATVLTLSEAPTPLLSAASVSPSVEAQMRDAFLRRVEKVRAYLAKEKDGVGARINGQKALLGGIDDDDKETRQAMGFDIAALEKMLGYAGALEARIPALLLDNQDSGAL